MRYEILLEKLFNGWDCCYNIRKTCGCVKPKKSNFKKLPILALELTKTEWKKKSQSVITSSKVFLCSRVIARPLPTSHFQNTYSLSLCSSSSLVSAHLSLSIILSFKPHFATSTNR